ncbi:MAG: hypothetical protein ACI837_003524, partial [Crocinitomicaceae bacterium]
MDQWIAVELDYLINASQYNQVLRNVTLMTLIYMINPIVTLHAHWIHIWFFIHSLII